MKKRITACLTIPLACMFPIIFIFLQNVGEVQLREFGQSAKIFLLMGIVVFLVNLFWMRSCPKAALISVTTIMILENFKFIESAFNCVFVEMRYWHILACLLFLLVLAGAFVKEKCSQDLAEIIVFVICIVFSGLILVNLIFNVPAILRDAAREKNQTFDVESVSNAKDLPNVYWLTFDEYSSFLVMEKYYDYDSKDFIEKLEGMGFNISHSSRNSSHKSSTVFTNYCNLNYVVDDSFSEATKAEIIKEGWLLKFLKENQYSIHGYGRVNELLGDNNPYIVYKESLQKSGSQTIGGQSPNDLILSRSVFYPLFEKTRDYFSGAVLNTFDSLENMEVEEKPTLVFSYLMLPHEPFIFNADGSLNSSDNYYNWQDHSFYRNQYIFTSDKIIDVVSKVVEKDPNSVIILQSDHSARAASDSQLYRKWISVSDMRSILNCVYYKGEVLDIEGLSGVETLRKVYETIFDIELPALLEVPYNE